MNINDIQSAMREAGSHWWDAGHMEETDTRILGCVLNGDGGTFFVASEKNFYNTDRDYFIYHFNGETCSLQRVSNMEQYKRGDLLPPYLLALNIEGAPIINLTSSRNAHKAAMILAGPKVLVDGTPLRRVSHLEDFERNLTKYGCLGVTTTRLVDLIRMTKQHHRYCEYSCGVESSNPQNLASLGDRMLPPLEDKILEHCFKIGVKDVFFQGDPRGATVKLVMHDGTLIYPPKKG